MTDKIAAWHRAAMRTDPDASVMRHSRGTGPDFQADR